jgi:hypothetical protein
MLYVHFTNLKDAVSMKKTGVLWKSSYIEGIFAVAQGGFSSPGVQQSKLGRVSDRKVAVIFKTNVLPDSAFPEEVVWHDLEEIPIQVVKIVNIDQLTKLNFLDESLPIDPEFDQLQIPLHPAFSWFPEFDWTRLPPNSKPWTPGKDNEKYKKAHALFEKGASVDEIIKFWSR